MSGSVVCEVERSLELFFFLSHANGNYFRVVLGIIGKINNGSARVLKNVQVYRFVK